MTRNFSNRRRDDMRPTSRTTSSGRYREEPSSRSTRPRLSRDTVDRAWENGATRRYADYRSRPNTSTPQNQRQGRPSPRFERSRPYAPRSYERREDEQRPYEHRQESYRGPSSFHRDGPPRQRRPEEGPRHFNEPGQRAPGGQPRLNSERWTRNTPPRRENARGDYRERYEDERPPRFTRSTRDSFERTDQRPQNPRGRSFEQPGPRRTNDRPEQRPRGYERPDREQENFVHGKRTGGPRPRRDVYNPRWQSRPVSQRGYQEYESSHERPTFRQTRGYSQPEGEQFEGDYEHFAIDDEGEQPEQAYEPHVTHLPDGRVLKGSRPAQRRAARFWTDVENETQSLLPHTPVTPEQEPPPAVQETPASRSTRTTGPRKQPGDQARKVKTVKTTRASEQKPRAAKPGKKKERTPKTVIHPSQRGYKWPAAGE